jgi:hypothetical protein
MTRSPYIHKEGLSPSSGDINRLMMMMSDDGCGCVWADSEQLAYSVREYITFEEWPAPRGLRVRDKAAAVAVRSHCCDAGT